MIPGESIHSMLPQDLPWWLPDHAVFFVVLYLVLAVIGGGVGAVVVRTLYQTFFDNAG
jgi:hypothetical protein